MQHLLPQKRSAWEPRVPQVSQPDAPVPGAAMCSLTAGIILADVAFQGPHFPPPRSFFLSGECLRMGSSGLLQAQTCVCKTEESGRCRGELSLAQPRGRAGDRRGGNQALSVQRTNSWCTGQMHVLGPSSQAPGNPGPHTEGGCHVAVFSGSRGRCCGD